MDWWWSTRGPVRDGGRPRAKVNIMRDEATGDVPPDFMAERPWNILPTERDLFVEDGR